MSLLKNNGDIDILTNKANYIKLCTATFDIYDEYKDETIYEILNNMYMDLLKIGVCADSVGIWIISDESEYENAISLTTLQDIEKYGKKDINPIVEFFKMTI